MYLRQVVVARSSICTGMLVCAVLKFIRTVAACPQTMFIFSAGLHLIERIFRTECQQLGCRENSSSHFKERLCLPMSCDVCIINACWQKSWTEFSRLLASTDILAIIQHVRGATTYSKCGHDAFRVPTFPPLSRTSESI